MRNSRSKNNIALKDLDTKQNIVSFYYSSAGEKDRQGDIVEIGAHAGTKVDHNLKHFKNHNKDLIPGVVKEVGVDGKGAFAVSQLMPSTVGKDTLIEYEHGAITQHSFMFNVLEEKFSKELNANIIIKLKTWEVSTLTAWGANEFTNTIGLKSLEDEDVLEMMKAINSILSKSSISDERAKSLEKEYEKMKQFVIKENSFDYILKNIEL